MSKRWQLTGLFVLGAALFGAVYTALMLYAVL